MTEKLQLLVLRILMNKSNWIRCRDIITPEIMPTINGRIELRTAFRLLFDRIKRIHSETKGDITKEILALDIEASNVKELIYVVNKIPDDMPDGGENIVRRWASEQWYNKAWEYYKEFGSTPDFNPDVHASFSNKASKIRAQINDDDVALSVFDAPLPGTVPDRKGIVGLGISNKLDAFLDGGVAAGELCIFLGPVSRGKSTVLCAVGAAAAARGSTVLHVTLELARMKILRRYEEKWTGLTKKELVDAPESAKAAREFIESTGGKIFIKEWTYGETTPNRIGALIESYNTGGDTINIVIIDPIDEMWPNPRYQYSGRGYRQEQRHMYEQLIREIRQMGKMYHVPVASCWQGNRQSYHSQELDITDTAESWGAPKISDIIVGLNQGPTEAANDEMRLSILKCRESKERPYFRIHADMDRCQFKDKE